MAVVRNSLPDLERRRDEVRAALAAIGEMRPGALVGRFRRCGKPNCHCAQPGDRGHGPSWSLTRVVAGKTVTRVIPSAAVELTQRQIAEHRRFRELSRELIELSEQLCDGRLKDAASRETAKKGGSEKRSRRSSSTKSRG